MSGNGSDAVNRFRNHMARQVLDITVLAGGPSRERSVSLASGRAVADALEALGYRVRMADIDPENLAALEETGSVLFIALHGHFGEDGRLQRILEDRGLTYCGSSPEGCENAFNKHKAKLIFGENDIPTPRYDLVYSYDDIPAAKACWSMPVVVKPVAEGSSIGITIVKHADEVSETVEQTLSGFGSVLVEEYIAGKELTVGILGDRALPIIEIRPGAQFYDYGAKYESDATGYVFEVGINADLYGRIQDLSLRASRALGLRDFCRADWRLDENGEPYLLEVNAIPGFTEHSLLPKAAARAGLDMPQLCQRIVQLALNRHRTQASVRVT